MTNITLIGLGKMGTAIATRLLEQGVALTVYNRTQAKMLSLAEKGAKTAATLQEAVSHADVVITCLLDDQAMFDMVLSPEGLPAYMKSGAIHLSTATLLPDTAIALDKTHTMYGSHYMAATVLGVPKVAYTGELTAFFAGTQACSQLCESLLQKIAASTFYLGENIKAPLILKICTNYALCTTIELISELYVFAEKSGLDLAIVQKNLHHIYGHPAFKRYIDKIKERNFDDVNFDMKGGMKDVTIFQKALADVGVPPYLADLVKSRQISALAHGYENKDWSSIYEIVRREAGLET